MILDQSTIDELKKTKAGKRAINENTILECIVQIRDTMQLMAEVFDSVDSDEINDHLLAGCKDYPFQHSFDEMVCEVGTWFKTLKEYYESH